MKTLIAYRTRYGTTESCARRIAQLVGGETVIQDLRGSPAPDVTGFDAVLLGGSIYGGKVQREIAGFCDKHRAGLLAVPVGLFICCLFEGEKAAAELGAAFPAWLSAHAFIREVLGGELRLQKLSRLDRLMARAAVQPLRDISSVREEAIQRVADAVAALAR